ncbi:Mitochondrial protein [Lachnellula suecica]|uniref:Mitochondrial protein n=1 Tax=Lachnellula suecica TaxID=602035 RepID=A0A8T9C1V2_9HELO|nr:Mitochondrial protein [Lachnellula suecica]
MAAPSQIPRRPRDGTTRDRLIRRGSIFNRCATIPDRFEAVFGPSDIFIDLNNRGLVERTPCDAINIKKFYKYWNRHSLSQFEQREYDNQRPGWPIVFSPDGRLYDNRYVHYYESILYANMPSSCKDIRAALAQCLQESDCVMIQRNNPADCLRAPLLDTMPTKCQQLKKGYGECKRGMVDMRKRFRGNQPIAVSKELEGGAQERGHMLYAGKPAFTDTAKETAGHEPIEKDWREVENEKFAKGQK